MMQKLIKLMALTSMVLSNIAPAQIVFAADQETTSNENETDLSDVEINKSILENESTENDEQVIQDYILEEPVMSGSQTVETEEDKLIDKQAESNISTDTVVKEEESKNIPIIKLSSELLTDNSPITFTMNYDVVENTDAVSLIFSSLESEIEVIMAYQIDTEEFSSNLEWNDSLVDGVYSLSEVVINGEIVNLTDFETNTYSFEVQSTNADEPLIDETVISEVGKVEEKERFEEPVEEISIDIDAEITTDQSFEEPIKSLLETTNISQEEENFNLSPDQISINKEEFSRGDILNITTENVSDYIDFFYIRFINEHGDNFDMGFSNHFNNNNYFRERLIGDDIPAGLWHISSIKLDHNDETDGGIHEVTYYDKRDSSEENVLDFSEFDFTVKDTFSGGYYDETYLSNIQVEHTFVQEGDQQVVTLDREFINEIQDIEVHFVNDENETYYNYHSIHPQFTVDGNQIILNFEIDDVLANGSWKIDGFNFNLEYLTYYNQEDPEFWNYYLTYDDYDNVNYHFVSTNKPMIEMENTITLSKNDAFDIYDHFTVTDYHDGDITELAEIELSNFTTAERGYHQGKIMVTNSQGISSEQRFDVRVIDPEIVGIEIVSDSNTLSLNVGDELFLETYETKLNTIDIEEEIPTNPSWQSKDAAIIEVINNESIKAVGSGMTYLFVESHGQVTGILVEVTGDRPLYPEVIRESKTIINRTYNSDLYINHGISVALNNVIVNGDIYVEGQLELLNSEINGNVYSDNHKLISEKENYWGFSETYYDDLTIYFNQLMFNRENFYVRIPGNEFFSIGEELYLGGYFLNAFNHPHYSYYYTKRISGLFFEKIGYNPEYESNFVLKSSNTSEKHVFPVINYEWSSNNKLNGIPELELVKDIIVLKGNKANFADFIKATDLEDGNIIDQLIIDDSHIDYNVAGYYYVNIGVEDSDGSSDEMEVGVQVLDAYINNVEFNGHWNYESLTDIKKSVPLDDNAYYYNLRLSGSYVEYLDDFDKLPEWRSEDEDIVIIEDVEYYNESYSRVHLNLSIKGISRGTTTIYTVINDITYSLDITVNDPKVLDFTLEDDSIEILTDGYKRIENIAVDEQDYPVYAMKLISNNPDIAYIEGDTIYGQSMGETTVTFKIGEIQKDIQVKVNPFVQYQTHVQSYGWDDYVRDGVTSGTVGQAKRLEGIKIEMPYSSEYGNIEYRTHVEKYGWMDWKQSGDMSGTEGEAKRLEAIQIRLTDELAERYDIYYRVHAQSYGWLDWAKNGEEAGTAGLGKRLEGIEVQLVEKGEQAPGSTNEPYVDGNVKPIKVPSVTYTTHVQSYGWQDAVKDGKMSGTSGEAKRLESIKIDLENLPYAGDIAYTTHVQSYGWQDSVRNGEMSGTSGEAKRLEAIRIALTGELAEHYDVYYRVHAQSYGWLGWAKNGASSGTEGLAKRLEGIEIKLVKKGEQAPGSTDKSFIK